MAKCDLCGQDAGVLKKRHKECQAKYDAGKAESISLVATAALAAVDAPSLKAQIAQVAERSYIKPDEGNAILVEGWGRAVDKALDDDILSVEEEDSLIGFAKAFSLTQHDLDTTGAYSRVGKAGIIRELLEGKPPKPVNVVGVLPFNFQKDEILVWVFQGVTYRQERTKTHYEGGYQGASVRVAKGLYYRFGGFRGHAVSTDAMTTLDKGLLGITDRHIYFAGDTKSFRVKYDKIVSFTPFSDAIGIQRDAQTARPQVFVTGDGWFTCNLITNLAKRTAA